MAILPKVVQQAAGRGGQVELKTSMEEKIRRNKMVEMDEATSERVTQSEKTKTAELEARGVEAESRKVNAEVSMAERVTPPSLITAFVDLLKDRERVNPQQTMTTKDVLEVMDYAKNLTAPAGGAEQPPDGVYGVITALITQMGQNKPISTLELIQTFQQMNQSMVPQQGSQASQMTEMFNLFTTMRNSFAPPPVIQAAPGIPVQPTDAAGNPVGGAINLPFPQLTELIKTTQDIRHGEERHQQTMEILGTLRKELPRIVSAGERQMKLSEKRQGKKPAGTPAGAAEPAGTPAGAAEPAGAGEVMDKRQCQQCGFIFGTSKGIQGDVLCPNTACPSNAREPAELPREGSNG